ncbi:carbon-phosphorus lyase complex subunit PhnI [Nocardia sp. NPDC059246]|uniref:carbon-phosphorus lyase complex subunit PhnI n=1 Tax=unclassified Nocardia TaxID=2637762 RepID=UPI0036900BEA
MARPRCGRWPLELDQISGRLRVTVDQVMSEGGLWDEETAARAFRHTEGDSVEAAYLVRSFRLSLPRLATTPVTDTDELTTLRRVVLGLPDGSDPGAAGRRPGARWLR